MNTEPTVSQDSDQSLRKTLASIGDSSIKKIVVAIHGIGDQYRNATVQSVVSIFGRCFEQAAAVPLGSFYSADGTVQTFRLKSPPEVDPSLVNIGFIEAYWADIPRRIQRRGYTIEETKAWARTVVERVRARYSNDLIAPGHTKPLLSSKDYLSAAATIEEMIDAIAVMGNLLFLAEKAGLFKFNLDELLTSFVGDVQIVADFANYRERILRQLRSILTEVQKQNPSADIYIVSHSEGTVVALLALLQAMCQQTRGLAPPPGNNERDWVKQVRGFMTIGSPIDKHLVLWIDMWDPVETPDDLRKPKPPIRWRNYYDYGDPIGFSLDTARDWLADHGWNTFFEFEGKDAKGNDKHDLGFARYYLPGKAHNDYWDDPCVFGHFICDVMGLDPVINGKSMRPPPPPPNRPPPPPPNRPVARISSVFVPFLLMAVLLFIAVYIPFTAVNAFLAIPEPEPWYLVVRDVTGIGFLLAGMTFASRIRCLTRSFSYRIAAAIGFTIGGFVYVALRTGWVIDWPKFHHPDNFLATRNTVVTALSLAFCAIVFSIWADRNKAFLKRYPQIRIFGRGARPLLIAGGITAIVLVAQRIHTAQHLYPASASSTKSFWPVILGGAAFIYLWWLAISLFDLTFTWHRYIRRAVWQEYLQQARPRRIAADKLWREVHGIEE
jgi:hypothetical protein